MEMFDLNRLNRDQIIEGWLRSKDTESYEKNATPPSS